MGGAAGTKGLERAQRGVCRLRYAVARGIFALGVVLFAARSFAQELSSGPGGDLTSDLPNPLAVQVAAPNVVDPSRREAQGQGFAPFHSIRTKSEGLGPSFINSSCGGCHVNNGRGAATISRSQAAPSQMVVKVRVPDDGSSVSPRALLGVGTQILDHSVDGSPTAKVKLSWTYLTGQYPDGARYELRKPKVSVLFAKGSTRRILTSLRMSPPIIGPGLLEAVPWETLLQQSLAPDAIQERVSGRINWVTEVRTGRFAVGRFGFKATHPTVEQQSAAALYNDMQITNPIFNEPGSVPEVSEEELSALSIYQKLGGVPAAVDQDAPEVRFGKRLFFSLGCEVCHRSTLVTGEHPDPELRNQTIHPYTDLLLHDMGAGLSDGFREYSAGGSEWRTTPLWGLRALPDRERASVYLHDGRARTIEEAIVWHGGEAARAQRRFIALRKKEREALLRFLRAL